jgi:hypothetical protein
MTIKRNYLLAFLYMVFLSSCFASCLTSKKMDAYVASQYGNELPKPKKGKADMVVGSVFTSANSFISTTVTKTSHFLPLIVYIQYDYRHTCTLNPLIGVAQFTKAINAQYTKLSPKLNGGELELTVEQVPSAFALVDKGHLVLLTIGWERVYVEPDFKDLVVSYKLRRNNAVIKEGKIDVKNHEKERNTGIFQSWKSSIREYLSAYDANMTAMNRDFINQLTDQL